MTQVTIGVPVYNGERTLSRAVESAVQQTHKDCVILISDNGSTDRTERIGKGLAATYTNVKYFRQPRNLGRVDNFRYLLNKANSPYFMWLAADDYLKSAYVARAAEELDQDLGLVACVSQILFVRPNGTSSISNGTYSLRGSLMDNLGNHLGFPNDNSRFYGLHRTSVLRQAFTVPRDCVWFDWSVTTACLLHGRYAEVQEILLVRETTEASAYMARHRKEARSWLECWLPMLPLTRDLIFRQKVPLRPIVLKALLGMNLEGHLSCIRIYSPRYASKIEPFLRHYVVWRLQSPNPAASNPVDRTKFSASERC